MNPSRRSPGKALTPAKTTEEPQFLLLDTHTFLWFVTGAEQLSLQARRAIENPANTVYVSAATGWEMAIKRQIGKLPDATQFLPSLAIYLSRRGFIELSIVIEHAEHAGQLPQHHRDPFDRMLIAQALVEGMTLVSNEALFDAYGVNRLW